MRAHDFGQTAGGRNHDRAVIRHGFKRHDAEGLIQAWKHSYIGDLIQLVAYVVADKAGENKMSTDPVSRRARLQSSLLRSGSCDHELEARHLLQYLCGGGDQHMHAFFIDEAPDVVDDLFVRLREL